MTREEMDFIGGMNMCDEISNEAYKKIMCHCEQTDWIPFDDESPDKDDLYFVTWVGDIGKSGGKFRGIEMLEYYDGGKWDTEKIEKRGYRNVRVTAWMELPEPWEEDEE